MAKPARPRTGHTQQAERTVTGGGGGSVGLAAATASSTSSFVYLATLNRGDPGRGDRVPARPPRPGIVVDLLKQRGIAPDVITVFSGVI